MNNAMTPAQFAQALAALKLTNAKLITELTAARADGKRTTAASASNWLTGKVAVPGPVAMFLRERLMDMARRLPPPLGGMKLVLIGGGKGGSGSSPMTAFLAAASMQRGYRVRVGATEHSRWGTEYWTQDLLTPFSPLLSVDLANLRAARAAVTTTTDLLLVDAGNFSAVSGWSSHAVELSDVDFVVIPFDPARPLDRDPALKAASILAAASFDQFLLQPLMPRNSVGMLLNGFPPSVLAALRERISGQIVFRRTDVARPGEPYLKERIFADEDLQVEYATVLDEVLARLGVDHAHLELQGQDFEGLALKQLLDYLGRGKANGVRKESPAARLEAAWREKRSG